MPFVKGQSGNPGGKKRGSPRHALAEGFIRDLHEDWKHNSPAVIQQVREQSPRDYLKVVSSILPKILAASRPCLLCYFDRAAT